MAPPQRSQEPPGTRSDQAWGEPELLGASTEAAPSRVGGAIGRRFPHRYRGPLVALLLVACLGAWWADQHRRSDEFTALITSAQHGQRVVDDSDRRVASMIEYVSPLLHAARTPPDVRAGLDQIVHASAVQAAKNLRAAAAQVAAVPVWGWHPDQIAARDAYVKDLQTRAAYYDLFLAPGSGEPGTAQPVSIETGWAAARLAFLAAATSAGQRTQVDQILTH